MLVLTAILNLWVWLLAHFLSDCAALGLASSLGLVSGSSMSGIGDQPLEHRLAFLESPGTTLFFLLDASLISVLNLARFAVWNSFSYLDDFSEDPHFGHLVIDSFLVLTGFQSRILLGIGLSH